MKKISYIICLFIISLMAGCSPSTNDEQITESTSDTQADANLKITLQKCGKADAIFLECSGKTIMIDTGDKGDSKKISKFLTDSGITTIDHMILTHLDKDHIGGAADIISNFNVLNIIQPNYDSKSEEYSDFLSACQGVGIKPDRLASDYKLSFPGQKVLLFAPKKSSYSGDNDYSIIVNILKGTKQLLFMGDAEEKRISEFLADNTVSNVDFLKVPHHGVLDPLSGRLFDALKPKLSVITCKDRNDDNRIVGEMLDNYGDVYYTCDGTVTIECDGKTINVMQDNSEKGEKNNE